MTTPAFDGELSFGARSGSLLVWIPSAAKRDRSKSKIVHYFMSVAREDGNADVGVQMPPPRMGMLAIPAGQIVACGCLSWH